MDNRSPWMIPLSSWNYSDSKSSNFRWFLLFVSMLFIMAMYASGICHLCRLWSSRSLTTLGNAPLTSRNKIEATCFLFQAAFIESMRRCSESVVVHLGLAPKWLAGKNSCSSVRYIISSAMTDEKPSVCHTLACLACTAHMSQSFHIDLDIDRGR